MQYAVEVARPVYRRTEGYGEGMGVDDAIEAAQYAARCVSADRVEVIQGNAFVAAILRDGKPVPIPDEHTEYRDVRRASDLAVLRQSEHVLGSKVRYDGTFRVRAGCAERTYERTIVHVDVAPMDPSRRTGQSWTCDDASVHSDSAEVGLAAREARVQADDPGRRWTRVPERPVAMLVDLMLVRGPDDDDGEMMAVPEKHGPLPALKGYHSPPDAPELPDRRQRAVTQALATYVTWVSANPEVARPLGAAAALDELQALLDEARRHLADR